MDEAVIKNVFRSIVRYINEDYEIAEELALKAEQLNRRCRKTGYKIGHVIPLETREKLYKMVG